MQPVRGAISPTPHSAAKGAPITKQPLSPTDYGATNSSAAATSGPKTITTSKEKGEFHLGRKEFGQAVEWFGKALQAAEEQQNRAAIIEALKDIGRAFLENGEWTKAAKALNSALALAPRDESDKTRQLILSLMTEVERRFLEKDCKVTAKIQKENYLQRRAQLQAARQAVSRKIKEGQPAQKILKEFTQDISTILQAMMEGSFSLFGKPPCDYAVIGLGSGGRQEMSPYSDLEFAFLLKENTPKVLAYFRQLVRWMEIQVIQLGETEFPILEQNSVSPTEPGFQFDKGGNTPLAKHVELLNTPTALADLQLQRYYLEDFILTTTLKGAGFQLGTPALYEKYVQAMQSIVAKKSKGSLTIAQERAWEALKGHLKEFAPEIDRKKEETLFDIKAELYRLPSFLIAALADYYGIDASNTWDKLDALIKLKALSPEGANRLKDSLSAIMSLRIRSHLHYGRECDKVFHPSMMQSSIHKERLQQAFILSDADIDKIVDVFRVIFPLHKLFEKACKSGNFADLAKEKFYDDSLTAQGNANDRLYRYEEAKRCYKQAIALNPDDAEAQLALATVLWRLADHNTAKVHAERALALGSKNRNDAIICNALNTLGLICREKGDPNGAIQHYAKAQECAKRHYGAEHVEVAAILNNLGLCSMALGMPDKAVKYYDEALGISRKELGDAHPNVATILNNFGQAWDGLKNAQFAIQSYTEALNIKRKVYGSEHPSVAVTLNNLGTLLRQMEGQAHKAIPYFEEASRIDKKVFGSEHPKVAVRLNNLGSTYKVLGQPAKAVQSFEEALKINRKAYGNEHPLVATNLSNLAGAWKALGDKTKARPLYQEALVIFKKKFGDAHPNVKTVERLLADL